MQHEPNGALPIKDLVSIAHLTSADIHKIFATALAFKDNILAAGGSEEPMVLYRNFRGKDPVIDPLLRRKGLVE